MTNGASAALAREMIGDMASVDDLYRPTNFWQSGLRPILDDIERLGVDRFREHPSATTFYAPVYGYGKYSERYRRVSSLVRLAGVRVARTLDNLMLGEQAAFDDYRLLRRSTPPAACRWTGSRKASTAAGNGSVSAADEWAGRSSTTCAASPT